MCRFTAYLGKNPLTLEKVLKKPSNSLVNQSRSSREALQNIHGDGCGIGWYNPNISKEPALFKSILPAWNDENLIHLTAKIRSHCFIGHVRASTIGKVDFSNCHPFSFGDLLFVHNGTVDSFALMKKPMIEKIKTKYLTNVQGQTDSEYFFALVCTILGDRIEDLSNLSVDVLVEAVQEAAQELLVLQKTYVGRVHFMLNVLITNGHFLITTRFSKGTNEPPLSLYYSLKFLNKSEKEGECKDENPEQIFVSSEVLDDCGKKWMEVPAQSYLSVSPSFQLRVAEF